MLQSGPKADPDWTPDSTKSKVKVCNILLGLYSYGDVMKDVIGTNDDRQKVDTVLQLKTYNKKRK